jgi:SAM-dependent methyltransferase
MEAVKTIIKKFVAVALLASIVFGAVAAVYFVCQNFSVWSPILIISSPILLFFWILYKYTSVKNPVNAVARRVFLAFYNVLIYRRMFIWEQIYDILCWVLPTTEWKHMNWGYASLTPNGHMEATLKPEDEFERFSVQLYHYVSTGMGIFKNLEGKTLLEVSSGRGGGLDYVSRYLSPQKCIGVDISDVQIKYCKNLYAQNQKLVFVKGESEKLAAIEDLKKEEVDIVINVESGHCYSNFKKFVKQVDKILRPGGVFCYSDFREKHEWAKIEGYLENYSMKIVKKENISENVKHSLELDEDRKKELLKRTVGPFLRLFFRKMGGVKGSHIYEGLSKGNMVSMVFLLRKPKLDTGI